MKNQIKRCKQKFIIVYDLIICFFKQLKDHKFYFRTLICIFPAVGMMKTVEWLCTLGSTVSSIDDSLPEVREFESHWDSNEVTLFLPAVYHRYGDSRWWIVRINKSYSLPGWYWSKLDENIIKDFIFLLSFINWNKVKFVYENSKSHRKQIFYIFGLTSSKSSITIWYLRKKSFKTVTSNIMEYLQWIVMLRTFYSFFWDYKWKYINQFFKLLY